MGSKGTVRVVDLRSDTVSQPTQEMRKAMFEAAVGDDVYGEDPTVNALEEKAAALLGKESGLFVPSGTMANLLAIMVHCSQRGSEMICGEKSHTFLFEQGGPAQIAGVQIWPLRNNPDGTFDLDDMEEKVRNHTDDHEPMTSLICVENTQNWCGGRVLSLEWLDDLAVRANKLHIPLHMDGARLFNAAVYLKVPASRIVRDFASATFCISKGLGAPVGAILTGDKQFIRKSRRLRKALGGGMRQAGVNTMVVRLAEDHNRANAIGKAVAESGSKIFQVDYENLQTNIVMININSQQITSEEFCNRLTMVTKNEAAKLGNKTAIIKICPVTNKSARLVTYYEITDADVEATICKLKLVMQEYETP
ncbi:probable low-specificity L-threonine aldolase 2 [Zootermopsis nevadensis]|nr:probable low-specificity L-threonine aldolase 2 [Zootermopsis nevadensis]